MILISALYTIDALTLTICNVFGYVNLIIEILPKFCCNVRYKFYMSTRLRSTYSILDINKPVSRSNKSDFDSQYIGIRTQFTIVGPRICVKNCAFAKYLLNKKQFHLNQLLNCHLSSEVWVFGKVVHLIIILIQVETFNRYK